MAQEPSVIDARRRGRERGRTRGGWTKKRGAPQGLNRDANRADADVAAGPEGDSRNTNGVKMGGIGGENPAPATINPHPLDGAMVRAAGVMNSPATLAAPASRAINGKVNTQNASTFSARGVPVPPPLTESDPHRTVTRLGRGRDRCPSPRRAARRERRAGGSGRAGRGTLGHPPDREVGTGSLP